MKNDFVIIASGASLSDDDINYVHSLRHKCEIIVINDNYKKAPWADYLYYCDLQWCRWHREAIKSFRGIVATCSKGEADWHFNIGDEEGLSFDDYTLNQGKNSGFQAINLACLMGANNIFLLGYDMKRCPITNKKHWFGDHPVAGFDLFDDFISLYDTMLDDLKTFGTRVINCNPNSALECFPKLSLKEVLR